MNDTIVEQRTYTTTKTQDIVLSGILIALVFVATKFINIRLPVSINGGLIHLGNTMLFMAAIVFGKRKGALAGAFGMGLFDVLSGWMAWAPFTFVIRGIMGYLIGRIAWVRDFRGGNLWMNMAAIIVGGLWMLMGYYIAESLLYGNWISPVTSVPGNIIQIVAGAALGLPLIAALKKSKII